MPLFRPSQYRARLARPREHPAHHTEDTGQPCKRTTQVEEEGAPRGEKLAECKEQPGQGHCTNLPRGPSPAPQRQTAPQHGQVDRSVAAGSSRGRRPEPGQDKVEHSRDHRTEQGGVEVAQGALVPLLAPAQHREEQHVEEQEGGIRVAQTVGGQAIHWGEE